MNQPEKLNKRVVSKTEYVALETKRSAISLSGTLLVFVAWGAAPCGVVLGLVLFFMGIGNLPFDPLNRAVEILLGLGLGYLSIRGGIALTNRGMNLIGEAQEMEEILPMTRANVGDLPASESLVRASAEPEQEQESVLLRASIYSEQTPAEQLLRPLNE